MNFNENNNKFNFNKKIIISVGVILLFICIVIVTLLIINSTKDNDISSQEPNNSNSSNLSYDGTTKLGTPVDFNIRNQVTLPKKVGSELNFKIGGNLWYYSLDTDGNAINVYVFR